MINLLKLKLLKSIF